VNTGTKLNPNDFDAHCIEANGNHIYYGNKGIVHRSSGKLDVDIITPQRGVPAVENITWKSRSQMPDGIYQMYVKNYSDNGGREGFDSEIECDGQIHEFSYPHELKQGEEIVVATVVLHNGQFTVNPELDSSLSSKEIWGIATNQWKRVSVIMPSPNHWDGQKGVGNKHIFFILDGCKNPTNPNGFFNEQLNSILLPHRKVFEVLGSRMKVEYSENQLSGVGFSTTQSNEVTLKIIGQTERIIKVKI
jgi:hypothetical protein